MKLVKYISFVLFCLVAGNIISQQNNIAALLKQQRLVIIMFDGFGMNYYKNAPMPYLQALTKNGFFKQVKALTPSVTNANNASIVCGNFPAENGITGNSFLAANGEESYMEDKSLLMSPTIFEKLKKQGIQSALIASKKKSVYLLSKAADIALSPEIADTNWIRVLGKAPGIYSPEVNYWSMQAAIEILKHRPEIRCVYIHTTDYPMHMWAPEDSNSIKHLRKMDEYIHQINIAAPDAMLLVTADHDLNHKSRCVDIEKSLAEKKVQIKIAISAERDKYLKHHRGFGGTSFIYLNNKADEQIVKNALAKINGVELVLSRNEAAKKYHLMPSRIGDLVAFADSLTVFGNIDSTQEILPPDYRTHGSFYEEKVPLLILNAKKYPKADYFIYNKDLTRWLFE